MDGKVSGGGKIVNGRGTTKARKRIRLQSKRGPGKHYKISRRTIPGDADAAQSKSHSLLLSSLKFWEVERDLIEERVPAMDR